MMMMMIIIMIMIMILLYHYIYIIYIYIHNTYNKIGMVSAIFLVLSEFQRFVTELFFWSKKKKNKAPESNDHLIIYGVS